MNKYSDSQLRNISRGVWVEGVGVMRDMAEAYLAERNAQRRERIVDGNTITNLKARVSFLKNWMSATPVKVRENIFALTDSREGRGQAVGNVAGAHPRILVEAGHVPVEGNPVKFEVDFAAAELKVAAAMRTSDGALARADMAVTLMIANINDPNKYHYWVDVVKNRHGNTSRHAFLTLGDATDFIEDITGGGK